MPLEPSVCRNAPPTTGVGTMNGGCDKCKGRTEADLLLRPRTRSTAASTLSRSSGVLRSAIDGRAIQKNSAISQAWRRACSSDRKEQGKMPELAQVFRHQADDRWSESKSM